MIFGNKEKEINKLKEKLEQCNAEVGDLRENDILNKQTAKGLQKAIAQLEADQAAFLIEKTKVHESVRADEADLVTEKIELEKLRADAKVNFASELREAFAEVFDRRKDQLDALQESIEKEQDDLARRLLDHNGSVGEIANRELAVTKREQDADAGFSDRAEAVAKKATQKHQENLAEAARLNQKAADFVQEREELEKEKAKLAGRERDIAEAEQIRDAGFSDERTALQDEFRNKRAEMESEITKARDNAVNNLEKELADSRQKRLKSITDAEETERTRIQTEIAEERAAWASQRDDELQQLGRDRKECEQQRGAVSAQQTEYEGNIIELESNERGLERKDQRLEECWEKRFNDLDVMLADRIDEERLSFEAEKEAQTEANNSLRETIGTQTKLIGAFDQLKRMVGDTDPAEIILELNSKNDELARLREELTTRPTEEMRERYDAMDAEKVRLQARLDEQESELHSRKQSAEEAEILRFNNDKLNRENNALEQAAEHFELLANKYHEDLVRLNSSYQSSSERDDRYAEIEIPHIERGKAQKPVKVTGGIDESEWLDNLGQKIAQYGFIFNPRILKAFHTALKTAEFSPITVLAGVSGTGKSELPRLYSHFGGLMYEPLSVQPNWDSQESMLGFFNSIDNKFDAQPVLRFLAQSQKSWEEGDDGYPGLEDAVCMILLDEMNLAHPELYWSEFLSKLEFRRGLRGKSGKMKGADLPFIPVKIGAGMLPYELKLGRNVLWAGTMNQDETTKSLSDKVLDRSIIIHFPRPTTLERREEIIPIDKKSRGRLLHIKDWQSWVARKSEFTEEVVQPYKGFIEQMNRELAVAGRAIGHRVWQSVEYYMANYPDVQAAQRSGDNDQLTNALHIAFEDQLVQKVMPKLRGIDTRGKGEKCLDRILAQLDKGIGGLSFKLREDFILARELGHGQFIWQSANYLNEPEGSSSTEVENSSEEIAADVPPSLAEKTQAPETNTVSEIDLSEPPPSYCPKDKDRLEKWSEKTLKQKRMYWNNYNEKT
jgi:hypothetical protein